MRKRGREGLEQKEKSGDGNGVVVAVVETGSKRGEGG